MRVAPWCTIAREQIWRSRQNCHAWQIATKRGNLMKLFAHWLDTQIHLWDQKIPKIPHRNPLKKGSLSENAMKEDERVLFQPFHAKGDLRGLHWDLCGPSCTYKWCATAISVKRFWQSELQGNCSGNSWSVIHAAKWPLVTAVTDSLMYDELAPMPQSSDPTGNGK